MREVSLYIPCSPLRHTSTPDEKRSSGLIGSPRHRPTVRSLGEAVSYERGTPVERGHSGEESDAVGKARV